LQQPEKTGRKTEPQPVFLQPPVPVAADPDRFRLRFLYMGGKKKPDKTRLQPVPVSFFFVSIAILNHYSSNSYEINFISIFILLYIQINDNNKTTNESQGHQ
jgi:hypothetical protein